MKVLVIGSGGREHAILWALNKSPLLSEMYILPGRYAMKNLATIVDIKIDDTVNIIQFCKKKNIELVIIGSEKLIIDGLADVLVEIGIHVFGPDRDSAMLEKSKSFTKKLCTQYGIPTADYKCFIDAKEAQNFIYSTKTHFPLVVKANGLARGKGVIICQTKDQACAAVDAILVEKKFGNVNKKIIIEEFLSGEEVSFFVLVDGLKIVSFGCAKDYKRVNMNFDSQNTGGMGSYSSPDLINQALEQEILERIIHPTVHALNNLGITYRGALFAGLMICHDGPKLLEYNVRFGDPEIQSILPRLSPNCDLLQLILSVAQGNLNISKIEFNNRSIVCVVVASKGYPSNYYKGEMIQGLNEISRLPGILVFHAGTQLDQYGNWISDGGRVLNIVADGETKEEAKSKVYSALHYLKWPGGFFRYDIGS
ncbi:phosphoribosylamine--glycine ligase [Wolbachia endosymbiont of Howardula sp.]|uniref:phosphoribosylamine--glycine ligase n=1 Tax=Wolbachia endosymbiont of Howardula sp. TaxID=2916816 RepID=UPI00217CE740|nr:phosphoribosylamine--glycine ligase [Wolbachia endosymbiont of Howardula sp.]UWI83366.1 phosphoribosylamine--glycine ligase [Wolbachia endosymbiont of Howardula sp.]